MRDELRDWPIPDRDIELDTGIAQDVLEEFLVYAKVEFGLELAESPSAPGGA